MQSPSDWGDMHSLTDDYRVIGDSLQQHFPGREKASVTFSRRRRFIL
jgi:hypothetical protein